jgi:hypothetical protein
LTVKVKSSNLWSSKLTEKQKKIYYKIKELRDEGLTYKKIRDYLNELGWTTIRGKRFSDGGVHSCEKKIGDRIKRLTRVYFPRVEDVEFTFEDDYDIKVNK